jgi:hypothetical protein
MKIFVNRSQESLEKKLMGTHCNALLIFPCEESKKSKGKKLDLKFMKNVKHLF